IHHFSFAAISFLNKIPGVSALIRAMLCVEDKRLERVDVGLKFKNPVGLAAGLDINASLFNELSNFGFGFADIGSLTPIGQPGYPKKRSLRLKEDQGSINRMGFNNEGVQDAVERLKQKRGVLIGGNIRNNKNTPNVGAIADYTICFDAL